MQTAMNATTSGEIVIADQKHADDEQADVAGTKAGAQIVRAQLPGRRSLR